MHSKLPIALLALSVLSTACITGPKLDRRLLLTEVSNNEVELYLDEDPSRSLILDNGFKLGVRTDDGAGNQTSTSLGLGAGGQSIQGGSFFIIWEESGYQGGPVAEPFPSGQLGAVPGIKVATGFLAGVRDFPAEIRLSGSHDRITRLIVLFPETTTDVIDDVVRCGTPSRNAP